MNILLSIPAIIVGIFLIFYGVASYQRWTSTGLQSWLL